jgi:hypothetical protein
MDGVIKKNSVVIFKKGAEEKQFKLGSAMPISRGDRIIFKGENLDGEYKLVDKKINYKRENRVHNVTVKYVFKSSDR